VDPSRAPAGVDGRGAAVARTPRDERSEAGLGFRADGARAARARRCPERPAMRMRGTGARGVRGGGRGGPGRGGPGRGRGGAEREAAAGGGGRGRNHARGPGLRGAVRSGGFLRVEGGFGVAQRGERDDEVEPMTDGGEPGVGGACGAIGTGEHVFGKLGRRSDGTGVVQAVLQPLVSTFQRWSSCGSSARAVNARRANRRCCVDVTPADRLGWSDHQPRQRAPGRRRHSAGVGSVRGARWLIVGTRASMR